MRPPKRFVRPSLRSWRKHRAPGPRANRPGVDARIDFGRGSGSARRRTFTAMTPTRAGRCSRAGSWPSPAPSAPRVTGWSTWRCSRSPWRRRGRAGADRGQHRTACVGARQRRRRRLVALWWRRRTRSAWRSIGVATAVFSGLAAGAGAAALFSLAVRGTRRQIVGHLRPADRATAVYPLISARPDFPTGRSCWSAPLQRVVVAGACSPAPSATSSSRCASVRELEPSTRSTRRGRPSGGGSPARCTTCSPTGCRCSASMRARSSSARTRRRNRRGRGRDPRDRARRAAGAARGDRRIARGPDDVGPPQPTLAEIPALSRSRAPPGCA